MGISVEFSHHEGAPGQQEIDLRYADALSTADNIMTFRLVVKEVALDQGFYASFMPKPFTDHPGSGMHTHLSLFEGERNVFYEEGGTGDGGVLEVTLQPVLSRIPSAERTDAVKYARLLHEGIIDGVEIYSQDALPQEQTITGGKTGGKGF